MHFQRARLVHLWFSTVVKLLSSAFFLLTSAYFFLAYVPYTNFFLIQAPPYPWLTWFGHCHSLLYWSMFVLISLEFLDLRRRPTVQIAFGTTAATGIWLTVGSVLRRADSHWGSYAWSLAVLIPFLLTQFAMRRDASSSKPGVPYSFSYSSGLVAAAVVAFFSAAGVVVRTYVDSRHCSVTRGQLDLLVWMLAAHLFLAVIAVSLLNAALALAVRVTGGNLALRRSICFLSGTLLLAVEFSKYLKGALSFIGWQLYAYVIPFSFALTCAIASILWPLMDEYQEQRETHPILANGMLFAIVSAFALLALAVPTVVGEADWNNVIHHSFNATFWLVVGTAIYLFRPIKQRYSVYGILAVALVVGAVYGGLELSSVAWAQALGNTPAEIDTAVRSYGAQNSSFGMVYETLHPESLKRCEGFCRILRQCTNMRDTIAKRDLNLVVNLQRSEGPHPNIFLIVVDSMRPDYLGAYNPRVDYTPNLDQFARESVVMRNAFTSYAGTSLSEPSIFAGSLLLHSHYPKPFSRENSLLKLAQADGYKLLVSDDPILRQVLDPSDPSVKLDAGKAWNEVQLAGTLEQLQTHLDAQAHDKRPIFLYTQPQNVHAGTSNRLLEMEREHWQYRPGFDKVTTYRVHEVDEIFGKFTADLKTRGLYDSSIIVVTSDHGDGLNVCHGHNIEICPEVLRVPLIIHVPPALLYGKVFDDDEIVTPSDIMPSIYYLLGHRPIEHNMIFGRPIFTETQEEARSYKREDVFFVSDARAAYGLLLDNGHYMYLTYDSPAQSFFYDLSADPEGWHNIITPREAERYNKRLVDYLFAIGNFYGYTPTGGRDGI